MLLLITGFTAGAANCIMPNRKRKLPDSPCKENTASIRGDQEVRGGQTFKKKIKKYNHPKGQSQSCHQCRQSIFSSKGVGEMKLGQKRIKCSSCTRYWLVAVATCIINSPYTPTNERRVWWGISVNVLADIHKYMPCVVLCCVVLCCVFFHSRKEIQVLQVE